VRSAQWTIVIAVVISVTLAAVIAAASAASLAHDSLKNQASAVGTTATVGVLVAQLLIAVLAVLSISGEYSTGMIKSTLVATPRRLLVLGAKTLVMAAVCFAVGLVAGALGIAVIIPIFSSHGITVNIFSGAVLLPVVWQAFYLAAVAVFSLGIGTILRSIAGAISTVLGVILVLPIILTSVPVKWAHDLAPYLIANSGQSLVGVSLSGPSPLSTAQQVLVVAVWAVVSIAGGALLLVRRDA